MPIPYTNPENRLPCEREVNEIAEGSVEFDIRDQKGRMVGYAWTISTVDVRWLTKEELATRSSYYNHAATGPMSYFQVWGNPTRDGKGYGPAFNYTDVETRAEADKLVETRIKNARKSAAKKFGKAA